MSTHVYGAPSELSYTVHAGWALALARLLESYGHDSEILFEQSGLSLKEIHDSHSRIPEEQMSQVWALAERTLGDSGFGLEIHRFITPTTFHALGIALWSSSSLHDALVRLARYGKVLSNGGVKSFKELDDCYCLTISVFHDTNGPIISHHSVDALCASIVSICRTIFSLEYAPLRVELERKTPENPGSFEAFFNCNVAFGTRENNIFFEKSTINQPLLSGDAESAAQAEKLAALRLAALEKGDIVNRVFSALIELIPSGELSEKQVARKLEMPTHQLQRKLAEQHTSYRRILDSTRKELALHYIDDADISLTEIAFLLGFSEQTNFTRAFKRWTNMAPGRYRSNNKTAEGAGKLLRGLK